MKKQKFKKREYRECPVCSRIIPSDYSFKEHVGLCKIAHPRFHIK